MQTASASLSAYKTVTKPPVQPKSRIHLFNLVHLIISSRTIAIIRQATMAMTTPLMTMNKTQVLADAKSAFLTLFAVGSS